VIIRILGEGQYSVDDSHAVALNSLDTALEQAVDGGDEGAFRTSLADLLASVREAGTCLADDALEPSDAVVPAADATLAEVKELLSGSSEGLIPG
jgi:hypothetical protein